MRIGRSEAIVTIAREERALARQTFKRVSDLTLQRRLLRIASGLYEVERMSSERADVGFGDQLDVAERWLEFYASEMRRAQALLDEPAVERAPHAAPAFDTRAGRGIQPAAFRP